MYFLYNIPLGFWERNEGPLIGAASGILIAVLASFLTYYLSRYNLNKKNETSYKGSLYLIHIELYWTLHHLDLLKKSLEEFHQACLRNNAFAAEKIYSQFEMAYVESSLARIIEYNSFKHDIVVYLLSYLHNLKEINEYIDFRNGSKLLGKISGKIERENAINDYFATLKNEYIDKTVKLTSVIRKEIELELKDYPKDKMIFKETNDYRVKNDRP